MELKGCAAIVTGGSGGLGQRICRALALNGHQCFGAFELYPELTPPE